MDAHQQALLQSTHDSTIRQEAMISNMEVRLERGDVRFKILEDRIGVVEEVTEPARRNKKLLHKVVWILIAAISYPAAAWIWEHVASKLGGKQVP